MVQFAHFHIPDDELRFTFARSSGPGGQNVNKVSSKAILSWDVVHSTALPSGVRNRFLQAFGSPINSSGEVVIQSDLYRDQQRNKDDCLNKLRDMVLSVARPPKRRIATKPTRASKEKRLKEKKARGDRKRMRQSKPDY